MKLREFRPMIGPAARHIKYGTKLKARLNCSLERMVRPEYVDVLTQKVMPFYERENTNATLHVRGLAASVYVIPRALSTPSTLITPDALVWSGAYDVVIRAERPQERDQQIYVTFSELEFRRHVELLEALEAAFHPG